MSPSRRASCFSTALLAACFMGLLPPAARADVTLTLQKTGAPDQVQLDWTAGLSPYWIWREALLQDLVGFVNPPVAIQPGTTYVSTDPGPLFHYLVGCTTGPSCPPASAENCGAPFDEDADGLTDCADPDCATDPRCGGGICGNFAIDGAEQCDDGNTRSGDGCSSTCTNEVVPACGDGILQAGEQCDLGGSNSDTAQGTCRTTCTPAGCGDSVVDYVLSEECDDGNLVPGDRCDGTCRIEAAPSCGDGALDLAAGEECDDGGTRPGDGCSATCQLEPVGLSCGDGTLNPREVCDDRNVLNGDACNPTCNLANTTTLFAGSPGVAGLLDGIGTSARFTGQATMAIDATTIWLAGNNVIRRIDIATADVVTVAGDAAGGAAGYVDDPVGLNARFSGTGSITTDGTSVWIGDEGNRYIRAMSTTPPYAVTTVAGSGVRAHTDGFGAAAAFDGLRGATYFNGYVYLLDPTAATLRRFDPRTTEVLTLAGTAYATGTTDGLGAAARFLSPRYMTSDNSGMLYVADTNGATIRSFNTVTDWVGTFAGSGTPGYVDGVGTAALVHRPRGMTSDGTSIYWVEVNQQTVRQGVLVTASVSTLVGTHCNGGAPCAGGYAEGVGTAALFSAPFSLAFHFPSNSLFVYDSANDVLRRIR